MKSKWNLLAYSFVLSFFFFRLAGAQGPGMNLERRLEAMKTRLALTDDQSAKVKDLLRLDGEARAKDREKFGDDREAMMKAAQERRRTMDVQIEALLTESQKKEYAKMKEEQRKRFEERAKQMNQ